MVALVVLTARSLAYALAAPTPISSTLGHSAGGPRLPVLAAAALGISALVALAVVWLAAVGVRERAALERRVAPRLSAIRVVVHALAFFVASALAFTAFESYLHLRVGLGWHGLACLTGPVHAGALPLLAGLSAIAAAVLEAARHLLAWLRLTIGLLLDQRLFGAAPALVVAPRLVSLRATAALGGAQARAPPVSA
jgi:hypothetical protein